MKKEIIRREFLKLKLEGMSYKECQDYIKKVFDEYFCIRILKYWKKRFEMGDWDLRDVSQKPNTINYKFYLEELERVAQLRRLTGYGPYQLKIKLEEEDIFMSESTIKRVVKHIGLSRGSKMEGIRLKWVRFERNNPNSMWQIDPTGFNRKWIIPVIDDCSRYSPGIGLFEQKTTENIIKILEKCISMHGKPREILTDNGSEFGGNGKQSNEFDKWSDKQDIIHIRAGLHKATTLGKVGRFQQTIVFELPYCFNDLEYFRWRYNCDRPHRSLNGLTPNQVFFGWKRHKKYLLNMRQIIKEI